MKEYSLDKRFWNAVFFKSFANLYVDASRTYLSFLWWILEPILFMGIYYGVFGVLLNFREENFAIFILVGLASWQWFDKSISAATSSILEGRMALATIPINRLFFPLVVVFSDIGKVSFVYLVLMLFLLLAGPATSIHLAAFFGVFLVQFLLVTALSIWVALLTPFLPDLRLLVGVILRGAMFASGVFYSVETVPEEFRDYFFWNPMALIIDEQRNFLLRDGQTLSSGLIAIAVVSILLIAASVAFSRRYGDRYLMRIL